jgi:ribonuclease P protein component
MKFLKEERLKSTKTISNLFKEGRSFSCYPLRLVYLEAEPIENQSFPVQFSLTVPKKNFKHAVDRNVLRRRLREAYRLNKNSLYNLIENHEILRGKHFAFMVMYVAKEELPYSEIEKGVKKMIYKFGKEAVVK